MTKNKKIICNKKSVIKKYLTCCLLSLIYYDVRAHIGLAHNNFLKNIVVLYFEGFKKRYAFWRKFV